MSLAPLWGGNRGAGAPSMPGPPPAASGAPGAQAAQPPPAAAAHGWTEHKAPDGRTYYFHKAKGVSAWEKPDEMKTEQEKVVAAAMQGIVQSKWKEYTSATGKKYCALICSPSLVSGLHPNRRPHGAQPHACCVTASRLFTARGLEPDFPDMEGAGEADAPRPRPRFLSS